MERLTNSRARKTRFRIFLYPLLCAVLLTFFSLRVFADEWPIYRKNDLGDTKKIALTFDDGPDPKLTPEILAILEEYGIKATFFVVGENV